VDAYEVSVRARLFTPLRGQFDYSLGPPAPAQSEALADSRPLHVGSLAPEVRYRNRESGQPHFQSASIPGLYYLIVEMSDDPQGDDYALPFTMRVDRLSSSEGAEAPRYTGTDATSPESPTPAPATDPDTDNTGTEAGDGSEDGLGPVRLVAGVAAAALGVTALVLAGVLLRRRTR
jgi:Ca-activated chloride channel family protein